MAPKTKKRPASSDGSANVMRKKPSTWDTWAEKQSEEEDDAGEEEEDLRIGLDDSSITQQQRSVFNKAMAGLPGLPGSLPDEIRETYEKAKHQSPKVRNAIVNAVVPKDASYGQKVVVTPKVLTKFKHMFQTTSDSRQIHGIGHTDLAMQWGHGNYELGKQAIHIAEEAGELLVKDGLCYRRSHVHTQEGKTVDERCGEIDTSNEVINHG